ncbi:hypothetical protein B9Z65_1119 [Elsinoe australis]|uniref:Uncharacterized protein n=1 Tax=Elsinoe australis TaxID=40998 RepID=A0A2P8AIF1_9PEZI|nr:hypothetical protein B9Z65_1119 [Elsinoe australis]
MPKATTESHIRTYTSISHTKMLPKPTDVFYYPPDIAHDLDNLDLADQQKAEVLATSWEYTRCVIPQYTNWKRYVAFLRCIIVAVIAEYRGNVVNLTESDDILGYSVNGLIDDVFKGTAGHELMGREFKAFLLMTGEKTSERRNGELFRRYVNALSHNPQQWFRMRDCDALARFTIAGASVCNDSGNLWFNEEQFIILAELGDIMYDAVAFYKHRSEGETHSTFVYMPQDLRVKSFHVARELLWALDTAWARLPSHQIVINFVRFFGGTIHMLTRRYRFVEEDLSIGKLEDEDVVEQTRRNVKLWNRVEEKDEKFQENSSRYKEIISKHSEDLMFPGLAHALETAETGRCTDCVYRSSSGAQGVGEFGGVQLCPACREQWRQYLEALPQRVIEVFPEVLDVPGFSRS